MKTTTITLFALIISCQTGFTQNEPKVQAPSAPIVKSEAFNPMGKTEAELIVKFGEPLSKVEVLNETTLMYPDVSYVLTDGIVTELKAGTKSWDATAQAPTPPQSNEVASASKPQAPVKNNKEQQIAAIQKQIDQLKETYKNIRFTSVLQKERYDEELASYEKQIRDLKNK